MEAHAITATSASTAMWLPEQITIVSYTREQGGGKGVVKQSAVGGAVAGAIAGGPVGAVVGGFAAAVAANAATPNSHIEYKSVVTIQGMQLERTTRWSACEGLCVRMKEHQLPEVKAVAAQPDRAIGNVPRAQ